jgi:hypothetical protein
MPQQPDIDEYRQARNFPGGWSARRSSKMTGNAVIVVWRPGVIGAGSLYTMRTLVVNDDRRVAVVVVCLVQHRADGGDTQGQDQRPGRGREQPRREAEHPSHDKSVAMKDSEGQGGGAGARSWSSCQPAQLR